MNADPLRFLSTIRGSSENSHSVPLVTLTFAQSCDAKIAGENGKQLLLSGKESMLMTHRFVSVIIPTSSLKRTLIRMRSLHDGILVGIGTALNDDPQLNSK